MSKVLIKSLFGLFVFSFMVLGNVYAVKEADSRQNSAVNVHGKQSAENPNGIIDPLFRKGHDSGDKSIIDPLFRKGHDRDDKGIIDPLFKKRHGHSRENKGIVDPSFKPDSENS